MVIFKYAWELVKLVGWATGIVIGGLLIQYVVLMGSALLEGDSFSSLRWPKSSRFLAFRSPQS